MNIAQMTVSGNVGAAPEIRDVNGTKVANFSVAVNESYTNKAGEKVENTRWYRIEAWDSGQGKGLVTAVIEKYVQAGITVYCQGTPIVESYEKDGTKMTASSSSLLVLVQPSDSLVVRKGNPPRQPKHNDVGGDDIPF